MKKHNRKQRPLSPLIPHPHPGADPRSAGSRSKYDPAKEDAKHLRLDLALNP